MESVVKLQIILKDLESFFNPHQYSNTERGLLFCSLGGPFWPLRPSHISIYISVAVYVIIRPVKLKTCHINKHCISKMLLLVF